MNAPHTLTDKHPLTQKHTSLPDRRLAHTHIQYFIAVNFVFPGKKTPFSP